MPFALAEEEGPTFGMAMTLLEEVKEHWMGGIGMKLSGREIMSCSGWDRRSGVESTGMKGNEDDYPLRLNAGSVAGIICTKLLGMSGAEAADVPMALCEKEIIEGLCTGLSLQKV